MSTNDRYTPDNKSAPNNKSAPHNDRFRKVNYWNKHTRQQFATQAFELPNSQDDENALLFSNPDLKQTDVHIELVQIEKKSLIIKDLLAYVKQNVDDDRRVNEASDGGDQKGPDLAVFLQIIRSGSTTMGGGATGLNTQLLQVVTFNAIDVNVRPIRSAQMVSLPWENLLGDAQEFNILYGMKPIAVLNEAI